MRTPVLLCVSGIIAWIVENSLFGEDRPGTAHDVATAFFVLGVLSVVTLLGLLAVALARRARRRRVP